MTPSLLTIVRRALEGECALPPNTTVLVAVSGGPDSMALLSALTRLAPKHRLGIHAHGVDHGLRPEAAAELDLAAGFAAKHDVPFERTVVAVARGGNLQARARAARYEVLISAARKLSATLATAHHAGDRAETMLMRLLRGSGARGLAVLPPRGVVAGSDVPVIRPLLRAIRPDVTAHLERHRIPFASDPSNLDPRYLRTRVRTTLMPLLEQLDPAIVSHLAALSDELGSSSEPTQRVTTTELSWTAALPRATQEALADLTRSRSKKARVWLPGGLVAMAQDNKK